MEFNELNLSSGVLEGLDAMNITKPTPVQELAIPVILDDKDLIACAQTGTGKTAAFVLPVIHKLANRQSHNKATTLILVPTRELAIQIDQQIMGFSYFTPATSVAVYGGNDSMLWETQKAALINGADIIIATPGRLITHLNFDYFKLDGIEHFILDEADRMLDMGFQEDITAIAAKLPAKRQTVMFSATMPDKIRKLAKKILNNPVEINLSTSKPAENILQAVCMAEDPEKYSILLKLLQGKTDIKSVVIFSSTKSKVKQIEKTLKAAHMNVGAIHSDLEQKEREAVMLRFRSRELQLLVATDIIARGIDVENIDLVVNFDVPHDPEDYVHRVGRTARAQADGVAMTFVSKKEKRQLDLIEKFLGTKIYQYRYHL